MTRDLIPSPGAISPVQRYLYLGDLNTEDSQRVQLMRLRAAVAVMTDRQTREVPEEEVYGLPWADLTPDDAAALRARLAKRLGLSHANGAISAVRGVLFAADALTPALARSLRTIKGERVSTRGRMLTPAEVRRLFRTIGKDHQPAGARDAAILGLGLTCALRVSELCALDLEEYQDGRLLIRHAKGNKDRRLWVTNGAEDALADWLRIRGRDPGPLFVRIHKGGHVSADRISVGGVQDVLARRATQAKVDPFTPHDLRRTAISRLLEDEDVSVVQRLAGHARPETTTAYDRRPEERLREAQTRLTIPYTRRD